MVSATVLKGYAPAEHSDASGHCLEAPTAEEGCVLRDDVDEAMHEKDMHTYPGVPPLLFLRVPLVLRVWELSNSCCSCQASGHGCTPQALPAALQFCLCRHMPNRTLASFGVGCPTKVLSRIYASRGCNRTCFNACFNTVSWIVVQWHDRYE